MDRGANVQIFNSNFENNTVCVLLVLRYVLLMLVPCILCGSKRVALSLFLNYKPSRNSKTFQQWLLVMHGLVVGQSVQLTLHST